MRRWEGLINIVSFWIYLITTNGEFSTKVHVLVQYGHIHTALRENQCTSRFQTTSSAIPVTVLFLKELFF